MTTVKAGQVWQDKNMGSRWVVSGWEENGDVALQSVDSNRTRFLGESRLADDYVLVKEAP